MTQISRNDSKLSKEILYDQKKLSNNSTKDFYLCSVLTNGKKSLLLLLMGTLLNEYSKSPNVNFCDLYTFVPIDVESLMF